MLEETWENKKDIFRPTEVYWVRLHKIRWGQNFGFYVNGALKISMDEFQVGKNIF